MLQHSKCSSESLSVYLSVVVTIIHFSLEAPQKHHPPCRVLRPDPPLLALTYFLQPVNASYSRRRAEKRRAEEYEQRKKPALEGARQPRVLLNPSPKDKD